MKILLLVVFMVGCFMVIAVYGEGMGATPSREKSPHVGEGHCKLCHLATEADLDSWFTFSSTKRKLRKDFNELCRQCHGVQFGHGVGKAPALNQRDLPLDAEGKIACAVTCHNMHVKSDDFIQKKYHLRLPQRDLCVSCHKE